MPKISQRGKLLPESSIRKLMPYADKAKRYGKNVIHLNIGQPDIKTPEHAIERLRNFNFSLIPYGQSAGNESYRNKLSKYYNDRNIDVVPDDIIITTGGSEAISFVFMTCFDPEEEVIIPEPFYANYHSFAVGCDVKIVPIMSKIEDNFKLPPISEFEKVITDKTKAIFICHPSNPTGYLYTKSELLQLKELAQKHDLYLIADEVYKEFVYDEAQHFSVMELRGIEDRVIMIDSVSKRFSACGTRIGSIVSKNRLVMRTILKLAMARLCPPMLGQEVAEAAVDAPPEYMQEVYKEYNKRRNFLVDALNEIDGVYVPMPQGAFYAMAKLPVDNSDKFCQWLLEEFEYNGDTVMLAPASGFYITPGQGEDQVRVAYVLNIKSLERGVDCIREALKIYPGRKI